MSVKVLPAMLYILLLCRALFAAEVQSLSIDAQLGTSIEDCFERISIGEHVSPSVIYRNVSELTTKECEQLCKQDRQCQTYDYGVGAKGNATCNLSNQSEKELKERNLLVKDPDYDVYVRRFQCEQSPPTPLKPLLDDPGDGPTHRPVFRPEIDEPKRPLADYPISQGFGQYPYDRPGYPPPRPIQPPYNNHLDERPDDYTYTKPDYDKPPSYGLHRPQEIPYRPGSYDVLQFQEQYGRPPQNPNWRPDPSYPPQSGDDIQDIYGIKPIRPKPDLPAYRPEEKPQYQYITKPNRIPRPPEEGGYNKPKPEDYRPDPYGPSNPYKPNYEYPSRPYEKPSYSYNNQYASQYGQNHYPDTSIYLEIYDPHRPYKPNKRPAYGGGSSGYSPSYGYSPGTSEYGGSYTNQNSYNQMQSQSHYYGTGTGTGTITQLDNYNRPAINYKPQKPAQTSGYGGQSQQIDQSYGDSSGSGGYGPPKPSGSYNKPDTQGSYGGSQGYGTSPESTYGGQSSQSGYGSSSLQETSQRPSYGVSVKPTYGEASYGQGSYQSNKPSTNRPSYGSEPSYDNRPTHSKPGYGNKPNYDDRPSYGNKPSYGDGPSYDNTPSYDRPSNTKPSYSGSASYGGTSGYGDSPSYGTKPSYNERPSNKPSSGYGEPSTDDLPSYGIKPGNTDKPTSFKPSYSEPSYGSKPNYDRPSYGNKPSYEDRPSYGNKPDYNRPSYDRPPYEEPGYGNKPQPQPAYNEPSYNRPNKPYDDNRPDGDPGPAYGEIGPSYGSTPKPPFQPPSYGTEDYKNNYGNNQSNTYWSSVKPVYEHEMERPHNVPSYIVRPGGEVVTSKPVAIGDYGGKPDYGREPVPGVSYRACFRRVLAGRRALRSFVRRVVPCEALEDCRRECATEHRFHCESFNYRMDLAFRAKGLCEMMTKPIEAFDLRRDFVEDKDYDFYEVDRNSLEPHCPETLRGPGHLHSGYLTSKPTRGEYESGWQRNDWHRGRFGEDQDRTYSGRGRYEDRFFVPYQIGVARSDNADTENWGGYGGVYGGYGTYYKNRNDYHKSISHWGLNDIKPYDYGVRPTIRPNFNYNDLGRNGWTENRYGYGAWKKGRWNTSGTGWSGLDYGESSYYKPPQKNIYLEIEDRSNSEDDLVQDCSSKRRPGMSLGSGAIRRALFARNVVECEAACFNEREFKCVSYSYRYSTAHNSDNCFLSERPYRGLELSADNGSDVYAMPQHQGCSGVSRKPWIESECFWHVRSGTAVGGSAVRAALTVAGLGACEAECIRAHAFFCRGFSFRFDPPAIGDDLENCILTSSPPTSLENGRGLRSSAGHELYSRGNYGRGCEPALYDDLLQKESGECYLQYDNAAKLIGGAVRGAARARGEQACAAACTNAPFRCLSFSYNNNAPPDVDNCLLSEIRLFDLQRGVDYQHSTDDWLFAFDLFNGQCWRKVDGKGEYEEPVQELPHPISPQPHRESGPSGPPYLPAPPVQTYPSGPVSCGNCEPSGPEYKPSYPSKPYPAGPGYLPVDPPGYPVPSGPDYKPGFSRPDPGYKPGYPNSGFRPGYPGPDSGFRPGYPGPDSGFKPGYPPDSGFKPAYPDTGYRPGGSVYLPAPSGPSYPGRPGSGPGYPRPQPEYGPPRPQKPQGYPVDREEPIKSSWRHYTVSGFPCRKGTTCAQNQVAGHWACEPEGGEVGSWDYCCAPSHRCGYSEGFHKPWCYVGQSQDQWRPCSEKYYPYHQHNVPHPSQGHGDNRPYNRPDQRPDRPVPRPDRPVPGQYLPEADRRYWDQLYRDGPQAYYDRYGNPLPGYTRVPMSNRPHIKYHHTEPPAGSGWVLVPPPEGEQNPPMPGGLGVPRYWPVAYLHKGPPPNMTYFRYNETDAPTTTQRYDYRPPQPPRDPPPVQFIKTDPDKPNGNNIDNTKNHRDEKNRNINNATEDVFQIDLSKVDKTTTTTLKPQIKETSTEPIIVVQKEKPENRKVQVEVPKPESVKADTDLDKIKGLDGKIDDFAGSIEVLDIKDAEKGDKIPDLKTLEAEERQIEAIGRLLASRRGGKLVLEKRSQKDLETKSIAVDKEATEFDFGNKFPSAERRGKIQRVSKDDIEKERNIDKSLEVSETTFVRPPRVLSTTENIRKAIINGKVFYDATIREQRDIYSNSTRKSKSLRPLEDSRAPSIFQNTTYGKKKIVRARNVVNPVRKVRRVYRRKYNPDEVRRRLLDREKNAKEQRELMSNKKFK